MITKLKKNHLRTLADLGENSIIHVFNDELLQAYKLASTLDNELINNKRDVGIRGQCKLVSISQAVCGEADPDPLRTPEMVKLSLHNLSDSPPKSPTPSIHKFAAPTPSIHEFAAPTHELVAPSTTEPVAPSTTEPITLSTIEPTKKTTSAPIPRSSAQVPSLQPEVIEVEHE